MELLLILLVVFGSIAAVMVWLTRGTPGSASTSHSAASPRPTPPYRTRTYARQNYAHVRNDWECPDCGFPNDASEEYCVQCGYYVFEEVDELLDDFESDGWDDTAEDADDEYGDWEDNAWEDEDDW